MSIAPWDWLQYFSPPVEKAIAGTGAAIPLIAADPMRVILMFANANTSSPWNVSTFANVNGQTGFAVNGNQPPIIFRAADDGPLPTLAWFGFGQNIGSLTVISVTMTSWPQSRLDAYYEKATIPDAIQRANSHIRHALFTGKR